MPPIRTRNYAAEYARRAQRATEAGFVSYAAQRKSKQYGDMGVQQAGVLPHGSRRIHDAVGYQTEIEEDWDEHTFDSTRVSHARYSPSRRELQVWWVNAPGGTPYPPYIYDGVDPATWTNFKLSGSPGGYVNTTLNHFPYRPAPDLVGV